MERKNGFGVQTSTILSVSALAVSLASLAVAMHPVAHEEPAAPAFEQHALADPAIVPQDPALPSASDRLPVVP